VTASIRHKFHKCYCKWGNLPQIRFSHHCTKTAWNFFGTLLWLFSEIF